MRTRCLLAIVATGLLAAAVPASASAPTPKSHAIVPVTSIGGVKLGMSYAQALATWGPGSSCAAEDAQAAANGTPIDRTTFRGSCDWRDEPEAISGGAKGRGSILFVDGKVRNVAIFAQQNSSYFPTSKGPFGAFKVKGTKLGLGSQVGKVQRALKAKGSPSGIEVVRGGKVLTFSSSGGKVADISIAFVGEL